jgi:drug/metabolite transporter (DMT)-like permease
MQKAHKYVFEMSRDRLGMWLGLLGVAGFSVTLPATRMAVAYLDPTLVGLGRSLLAGGLAAVLLLYMRQPLPSRAQIRSLLITAAGVIVGFPLLSSWAMRQLPAAHGAIVVAILPMFTAIAGAIRMRERPSAGFWLASLAGTVMVLVFMVFSGAGSLQWADAMLILASLSAAVGYAEGGRLAKVMGGWQVICWALVLAAPFLIPPVTLAIYKHGVDAPMASWLGFLYVGVISQFLAFVFWYQGMAIGGVVRVSQVQLLQPFMTLLVAAVLLGEHITPTMLGFAVAVVITIAVGRRMPIAQLAR